MDDSHNPHHQQSPQPHPLDEILDITPTVISTTTFTQATPDPPVDPHAHIAPFCRRNLPQQFKKGAPRPPGAGRKKGLTKLQFDLAVLARTHTAQAVETMAYLMLNGKSEMVRLAAAEALLNRGYGKATVHITQDQTRQLTVILAPTDADL